MPSIRGLNDAEFLDVVRRSEFSVYQTATRELAEWMAAARRGESVRSS